MGVKKIIMDIKRIMVLGISTTGAIYFITVIRGFVGSIFHTIKKTNHIDNEK